MSFNLPKDHARLMTGELMLAMVLSLAIVIAGGGVFIWHGLKGLGLL